MPPWPTTIAARSTVTGTPSPPSRLLDLAARAQVGGEVLVVVVAEPAHVDDLLHPGRGGRGAEGARGLGVLALEVGVVEGVDEVDRHVDVAQRLVERGAVRHVGTDRLARAVVRLRAPGHRPDVVPGVEQGGDEAAADEAGGAGDEDGDHASTLSAGPAREPQPCAGRAAFLRASRRAMAGVAVTPWSSTDDDDGEGDRRPQPRLVGDVLVARRRRPGSTATRRRGRRRTATAAISPRSSPPSSRPRRGPARATATQPASGRTTSTSASATATPRQSRCSSRPRVIAMPEDEQHEQGHQPLEPLDHSVHRALVGVAVVARRAGASRTRRPRGSRSRRPAPRHRTPPAARPAPASAPRGRPGAGCRLRAWKAWRPSSQPTARRRPATPTTILPTTYQPSQLAGVGEAEPAGHQQQGEVHEREGEPVVEPGLGGEREPDVVVLVAVPPSGPSPSGRRRRPR